MNWVRPRASSFTLPVLGLLLSIVAGWLAVQGIDLSRVGQLLGEIRPEYVLFALCVVAVELVLRSLRWSLLLPAGPTGRPLVRRLVPIVLIGYLLNTVLPARIGDAAIAVLAARREDIPVAGALGSVVLVRVIDTLTLALFVFPAALLSRAPDSFVRAAGAASLLAGLVFLIAQTSLPFRFLAVVGYRVPSSRGKSLLEHAGRFFQAMDVRGRARIAAAAFGCTAVAWFLEATAYWLTSRSLGIDLPPVGAFLVAAVAVLGTAVPSAPGYVGTFDLAASAAARAVGVGAAASLALALLVHAVTALPLAIGGVVSLVWIGVRPAELWQDRRHQSQATAAPPAEQSSP